LCYKQNNLLAKSKVLLALIFQGKKFDKKITMLFKKTISIFLIAARITESLIFQAFSKIFWIFLVQFNAILR